MNAERIFLELLIRNQSEFEEARELYDEVAGEGLAALDTLIEKLDLDEGVADLAEEYVRGSYDPLED